MALPRKSAEAGEGAMRWASRTLIALLAGPGLVEGGDGGEEDGDPEDSAGDLAGEVG